MQEYMSNPDALIGAIVIMTIPLIVILITLTLICGHSQVQKRNARSQGILKNGVR